MNNNLNRKKLGSALFIMILLFYFMMKTPSLNSKIIFIPFIICAITMVGKNIALLCGKKDLAVNFSRLFTIGFLLFWFGFLSVTVFICIRDKNYNTPVFTLPFWIIGIFIVKRRFFRSQSEKKWTNDNSYRDYCRKHISVDYFNSGCNAFGTRYCDH